MSREEEPCPCESQASGDAPGPVSDEEKVIRLIPDRDWLFWDDLGQLKLSRNAFPKDELAGKNSKSVSVLRKKTSPAEVRRRGNCINREPSWTDDPAIATAKVSNLRRMLDKNCRREICVNADPVTDKCGFCPTHASILRAKPPLDPKQRLEWNLLRDKLADKFTEIRHHSGRAPTRVA